MSKYAEYQKKKNFQGAHVVLLEARYKNSDDVHELWATFALYKNEKVAALLIAYYGSSCTLLVSWSSDKARELNAGNFILWNSILYSKTKSCLWFDQGGIDKNNSHVAKFKRGIPCEEYELIGEYIGGI